MWGNIWTESSNQLNFNIGFSSLRSDVLIHLAQWQYWWWFWFSLVWSFYYFLILKIIRFRVLKMKPKISTSFRPHGKWGDFLACIIPLIWCINILTNSNLILKLIEWQNESSLFTVRVRARQWYWIYKFELKNFTDILSVPKNIGNNRWNINTFGELQTSDDYLHILQLRSQNKWVKNYWNNSLQETNKLNKTYIVSAQEQLRLNLVNQYNFLKNTSILTNNAPIINRNLYNYDDILNFNIKSKDYYNNLNNKFCSKIKFFKKSWKFNKIGSLRCVLFFEDDYIRSKDCLFQLNILVLNNGFAVDIDSLFYDKTLFYKNKKVLNNDTNIIYKKIINTFDYNNADYAKLIKHEDFDEYSRWIKRSQGSVLPLRLIKFPLGLETSKNNFFDDNNNIELFRFRFNDNTQKLQHKIVQDNIYLTLKQKRYNRKKIVPNQKKYYMNVFKEKLLNEPRYLGKPYLADNKVLKVSINDPTIQYKLIKKNKIRGELIPVTLAKRLLRTKSVLVLPAHANITVITNSYDIVHSWFIPSLGIKLDCVPGRSTHHTFFIDNVGFYYGQCAEICGRYHHHMPIRICALPFEHFLLWWNVFGLPKMLNTNSRKRFNIHYSMRKYTW